ncbi:MAG: hemerythrin domain-containing protein [bacterium]|nr:hemerythrin domain-containing protein [bacterium]MDD5756616.1 hemerythrin domain-containing protein [bacterium]
MQPIGPLMKEHRLIEQLIKYMSKELEKIRQERQADIGNIDMILDFIKTYADKCHHGKEEDILFQGLDKKPLIPEHRKILQELLAEHKYARGVVNNLQQAKIRYSEGNVDSIPAIMESMDELTIFYPRHIEKEDKHFFLPVMKYFSPAEQEKMVADFAVFDQALIHDKYQQLIKELEQNRS